MAQINTIQNQPLYVNEIKAFSELEYVSWDMLRDKTILIVGATGLIGSCLIDCLMYCNEIGKTSVRIIATSRNAIRAQERFMNYLNRNEFRYVQHDCFYAFPEEVIGKIDYMINAASNTHPVVYSNDPVGTITTNIFGTYNLLEYLIKQNNCRMLFLSSVEIYGENNTGKDDFSEEDCEYIDCNTKRAGYPESKRLSETLCQAYISKYGVDIVVARLCRVFGPTMIDSDSKALSQFIKKAVMDEDIVLKSEGNQYYSYIYSFDAVAALLVILLKGEKGLAYNVADEKSNITLKELANIIAELVNRKVIFELPNSIELSGFSTATKAILDSSRINKLGFKCRYNIKRNLYKTIKILKGLSSL